MEKESAKISRMSLKSSVKILSHVFQRHQLLFDARDNWRPFCVLVDGADQNGTECNRHNHLDGPKDFCFFSLLTLDVL
jgi:hypothetical protein